MVLVIYLQLLPAFMRKCKPDNKHGNAIVTARCDAGQVVFPSASEEEVAVEMAGGLRHTLTSNSTAHL